MNRTVAIVLTIVTILFCGLPGIGLICLGGVAAAGGQSPEILAQAGANPDDLYLGVAMFLCVGFLLLLIPILVGFFSFRLSKGKTSTSNDPFEPIPPAS